MLIQIEDRAAGSDLTLIPLEINMHFFARHRQGHLMKYGRTQEIKGEYGGTIARVKDCQFVVKEQQLGFDSTKYAKASGGTTEDDDDFDDEDDEEDGGSQKVTDSK